MRLTKEEYLKIEDIRHNPNATFFSNEGLVFRNPQKPNKIIKIISNIPEYLKMKTYTIESLLKNHDILRELKISLPEEPAFIESTTRGYQSTYIEGKTLGNILEDYQIPLDIRINLLKQVGALLRNMATIRKTTSLKDFYYNDIHEDNFIVSQDGIVYGVDIDSCSIENNTPSIALYPSLLSQYITSNSKYHYCKRNCDFATNVIPDENLDIYSYIIMILNFMYGKQIDDLNKDKLLEYLDFLEFYGGNQEFLYCLSRIYDDTIDNINPDYLLEHIKEIYQYSNYYYDKSEKLSKVLR